MQVKKGVLLEEAGGEVITVDVKVNGKKIFSRSAAATGEYKKGKVRTYLLNDGTTLKAKRDDGIKALAKKLLE